MTGNRSFEVAFCLCVKMSKLTHSVSCTSNLFLYEMFFMRIHEEGTWKQPVEKQIVFEVVA